MVGLGISNFSEKCKHDYASKKVSKSLANLIIQQPEKLPSLTETLELRPEVQKSNRLNNLLHEVENTLMPEQKKLFNKQDKKTHQVC